MIKNNNLLAKLISEFLDENGVKYNINTYMYVTYIKRYNKNDCHYDSYDPYWWVIEVWLDDGAVYYANNKERVKLNLNDRGLLNNILSVVKPL